MQPAARNASAVLATPGKSPKHGSERSFTTAPATSAGLPIRRKKDKLSHNSPAFVKSGELLIG